MDVTAAHVQHRRGETRPADDRERHPDRFLRRDARRIDQHRKRNDRSAAPQHGERESDRERKDQRQDHALIFDADSFQSV